MVTLLVELAISLALLSDTLGLFAILAMPLVGIAWLPASLMILSDLRQEARPALAGYLVAAACGLAGVGCIGLWLKWIVMAAFVK